MPFDNNLCCSLLKASSLAYNIVYTAGVAQSTSVTGTIAALGYDPSTLKFKCVGTDPADIDACYFVANATTAILAFRGTLNPILVTRNSKIFFQVLSDWLNDGRVGLVSGDGLPGRVHQGFLGSLDNLWPDIGVWLADVKASGKQLYITGHSKGGGLAYLATYRAAVTAAIVPSAIYTFAAPRVGDAAFASRFNAMLGEVWRLEYQDDLVPHLPPETAAWAALVDKLRSVMPHVTPLDVPWDSVSNFERLLDQVRERAEKGLPSYTSAGELQFIDWHDLIEPDSPTLKWQRETRLAMKLVDPPAVIEDHLLENYSKGLGCQF
jgi:Lipase (class 3)